MPLDDRQKKKVAMLIAGCTRKGEITFALSKICKRSPGRVGQACILAPGVVGKIAATFNRGAFYYVTSAEYGEYRICRTRDKIIPMTKLRMEKFLTFIDSICDSNGRVIKSTREIVDLIDVE